MLDSKVLDYQPNSVGYLSEWDPKLWPFSPLDPAWNDDYRAKVIVS